ncbi:50S ribosomal protein L11 methyltransferase [Marinicauda salina]|uniref:Ribosomal protein L11 methyltransferase n=2 Tax=Marinicauda salina TaxID=2135793 RepID=A0A2U2BT11_9PROT|nr:50S ribosomal protein L11 methyltransferase [Marinicauda salina]
MTALWRLEALGPMDALKAANDRLDAMDEPPALAWSLFEQGEPARGRLDVLFAAQPKIDAFLADIGLDRDAVDVSFGPLPEEDWVRLSLQGLAPVEAGRFVVHGAHDADKVPAEKTGILIEAGPAFGTGHHGTTKGCLIAVDRLAAKDFAPHSVLDLGCGTGALAIAAAKLWPEAVIAASDIDSEAVLETRSNAEKNGVAGHLDVFEADGFESPKLEHARFDLILANILAGPLERLARQLAERLKPGGRAILSGLLDEQAERVATAYAKAGLKVAGRESFDGWTTLVLAEG